MNAPKMGVEFHQSRNKSIKRIVKFACVVSLCVSIAGILFFVIPHQTPTITPSFDLNSLLFPTVPTVTHRPLTSKKYYHVVYKLCAKKKLKPDQSIWPWIPPDIETSDSSDAMIKATPSVVRNGGEVTVEWESLHFREIEGHMDWIGLYCSDISSDSFRMVDFWWVKELTNQKAYYKGQAKFALYSTRSSCQFRYFFNDTTCTLMATSNDVQFVDSQNAHLHVHLALTGNPSEMRVQWTTGKECTPTVRYGTSPGHLNLQATGSSGTYRASDMCGAPANRTEYFFNPGQLHDVLLTKLTPYTQYYYQVGGTGVFSEVMSFKTSLPEGNNTSFSFLVYGDMDITQYTDQTIKGALTEIEKDSSFVLHIGDLSYATGVSYRWEEWMTLIEPLSIHVPYMVSVGNHDQCFIGDADLDPSNATSPSWCRGTDSGGECGVPTSRRFHMPDSGNGVWWYSFKYGLVHFIQISTEHSLRPGSIQYAWLEAELKSVNREVTPWLIVTGHRPLYTSQRQFKGDFHTGIELRKYMENLLQEYQVDLYVAGHIHMYERTCGVYNQKCVQNGTTHVTVGTSGTYLDDGKSIKFDWLEKFILSYGYGRVTVKSKSSILWEFVSMETDHTPYVSDSVWLVK